MQSRIAMIRNRGLQKIIGELQALFARHNAGGCPQRGLQADEEIPRSPSPPYAVFCGGKNTKIPY